MATCYSGGMTTANDGQVLFEWGAEGLRAMLPHSDVMVIVDVLSFTTAVEVAVSRGATVWPSAVQGEAAERLARAHGAVLAARRGQGLSLSPVSLRAVEPGTRLVLPSPNGATLSTLTGEVPTLAGCLRNAAAVARAATSLGRRVAVIAAGERWRGAAGLPDGTLRPGLEDMLGAGAIIASLPGERSPEAAAAEAVYRNFAPDLLGALRTCTSGQELIGWGYAEDVALAAELNCSQAVPRLQGGAYTAWEGG